MILLDTNVVSEPLKAAGNLNVLAWIDTQTIESLYLSTISLAELRLELLRYQMASVKSCCILASNNASCLCLWGVFSHLMSQPHLPTQSCAPVPARLDWRLHQPTDL